MASRTSMLFNRCFSRAGAVRYTGRRRSQARDRRPARRRRGVLLSHALPVLLWSASGCAPPGCPAPPHGWPVETFFLSRSCRYSILYL